MSIAKNMCSYKYGRGVKNGQICKKNCFGELCAKHKKNIKKENSKIETQIADIEMLTENEMDEDEEMDYEPSIKTDTNDKPKASDDILITKYFVNDCIREFFRDHNEMNELLGKKSQTSSSSNMTSILGMAGISLLPILMRNLSNMNIDAVHKQGVPNEIHRTNRSNTESERETSNTYGQFEISESIKEKLRTEINESDKGDQSATERILENLKRQTKA